MRVRMLLASSLAVVALAGCGGGGGLEPVTFLMKGIVEPGGSPALYGYDAQGMRLRCVSGSPGAGWGVSEFRTSPDGDWAIFVDDKAGFDREQAFLADLEVGSEPVPLTTLPVGVDPVSVSLNAWSPDSTRVTVHGNLDGGPDWRLYVLSTTGGAPVPLSTPGMKLPSSVTYWSPDGSRVTWLEGPSNNGPWVQRVANADGTGNVIVSGLMVVDGGVRLMQGNNPWSSDSLRLVYVADKEVDEKFELYSIQADGMGFVKLSPPLGANADVVDFECSDVGGLVAFKTTTGNYELRTIPIAAGGLSVEQTVPTESVGVFQWQPGTLRLAWSCYDFDDGVRHLRSRVVGSATTEELHTCAVGEDLAGVWRWSPTGERIGFRVGDEDPQQDHMTLHTVPGDGSAPSVNVLPSVTSMGDTWEYGWQWSPDGTRLLVVASEEDVTRSDLYLVLANGTAWWQLSDVSAAQEGINDATFSRDGDATAWLEGWSAPDAQMLVGGAQGPGSFVAEWGGPDQEMDELSGR